MGKTWDPKTRKDVMLPFADYVNTRLHFEKVLVLWGAGGMKKTPAAAAVANHLAQNFGVGKYVKASSPEVLKIAQQDFGKGVPVILEDTSVSEQLQLAPGRRE